MSMTPNVIHQKRDNTYTHNNNKDNYASNSRKGTDNFNENPSYIRSPSIYETMRESLTLTHVIMFVL